MAAAGSPAAARFSSSPRIALFMISRRVILIGAGSAVGTILGIAFLAGSGTPPAPASSPDTNTAPGSAQWFGALPNQASADRMPVFGADSQPKDGELIVDKSLLELMNVYLVEQARQHGADRLQQELRRRFAGQALARAIQISQSYQRYIKEHDILLASQHLDESAAAPDIPRIRVWLEQRARLRQGILGPEVTQAWYGDDEVRESQVLAELEQRASGASGADTAAAPGAGFDPRTAVSAQVKRREALQHARLVQDVVRDISRSFASQAN
jgi:hypothetical protein